MPETISTKAMQLESRATSRFRPGGTIFALAIIGFAIETIVCARSGGHALGPQSEVIPVLPWLPAIPWLGYLFGVLWVICAVGLLFNRTVRAAAMILGGLLFGCTLILIAPKYAVALGSIPLRTVVFEPLAIACLALLLPAWSATPIWLTRASRYLLAVSLIVFGVDHFLALSFIANLLPGWIPLHVFWVAFFGVAFIAAGISIAVNYLLRCGAAGMALMFGTWVITLHLPRVLGLYGIPGALHNPAEWSSLLIAMALWGGFWALAGVQER